MMMTSMSTVSCLKALVHLRHPEVLESFLQILQPTILRHTLNHIKQQQHPVKKIPLVATETVPKPHHSLYVLLSFWRQVLSIQSPEGIKKHPIVLLVSFARLLIPVPNLYHDVMKIPPAPGMRTPPPALDLLRFHENSVGLWEHRFQ